MKLDEFRCASLNRTSDPGPTRIKLGPKSEALVWTWPKFLRKCDFENQSLKFPIPTVLDLTGCSKCRIFFRENVWKSVKNYIGCDRRLIKVKRKSQNRQMIYFSPLCQILLLISQNRPVQLVLFLLECITHFIIMWYPPEVADTDLTDPLCCRLLTTRSFRRVTSTVSFSSDV